MQKQQKLPGFTAPDSDAKSKASSRLWFRLGLAQVTVFVACLAYWLYRTEFQYVDAVRLFDFVEHSSWFELVAGQTGGSGEYRPLQLFFIKLANDLSGGPSLVVFRTLQLAIIGLFLVLFLALMKPEDATSWFGFTVGFCCLVGIHTSKPMMVSAMPLGHALLFVNILLFASLLLLRQRPRPIVVDGGAVAMSLIALLFIEGGILVACLWLVAGAFRWGAARWQTAGGVLLVLVLYGTTRLLTHSDPLPGPFYTETGFLFQENLTLAEQAEMFTGRTWLFHGYNVLSTLLTVLIAEPREGVYYAVDALVNGTAVQTWQVMNWIISPLSTLLIIVAAIGWRRSRDTEATRLVVLGLVVLSLNSALGYMYTRDRIPSVAGAYYALLLGLAVQALWKRRTVLRGMARRTGLVVLLVAIATGWAWRAGGTVVWTRDGAWSVKDEWTDRYERLSGDHPWIPLQEELRQRALRRSLRDPRQDPEWMRELFERRHF